MTEAPNTTALAIVRELLNSNPESAERQLALIGHAEGDSALALITEQLTPAEVFAFARMSDSTKSSLAQAFASPKQFVEAFSLFGSQYTGPTPNLSRDIADFLHPFICEGGPERRNAMIQGFLKHPLSMRALCAMCVGERGFIEYFSRDPEAEVHSSAWQQIILFLYAINPKAFTLIRERIREMTTNGQEDLKKAESYCNSVTLALIKEARRVTGQTEGSAEKSKETFVGI